MAMSRSVLIRIYLTSITAEGHTLARGENNILA